MGMDFIAFPTGSSPGEIAPEVVYRFGVLAGR